jgi:hypothetical protein
MDETCTLDQWITSAMAAMHFAIENWPAFCQHTAPIIGGPVPIGPDTMQHHAEHLAALSDPERMPE